VKKPTFN